MNAVLGCIDKSLTHKASCVLQYHPGLVITHRVLSPIKAWQMQSKHMHKERDQDVKRLGTTSYEERLKEAEGFALGGTR